MNKRIKKGNFLMLTILLLLVGLTIFGFVEQNDILLSFLASVFGTISAILIFIFSEKIRRNEKNEKDLYLSVDEILENNNLLHLKYKLVNQEEILISEIDKLIKTIDKNIKLYSKIENEGKFEELNFTDLLKTKLFNEVVYHKGFEEWLEFISENDENFKSIKANGTHKGKEETYSEAILGDWIIKYEYAKKVKYLIGLSGYDNKIIEIYKLNKESAEVVKYGDTNRIRFSEFETVQIAFDKNQNFLENWTSRNPVLYLNAFSEYKEDLREIIEKLIEKEKESTGIGITGKRDILVVKVFSERIRNMIV